MRKKSLILIGILTCIQMLGGCGTAAQVKTTSQESSALANVQSQDTAESVVTADEAIESETQLEKTKDAFDANAVYDAFLNNETKASISFAADKGYYSSFKKTLEDGKEYTLEEITDGLKDGIDASFMSENNTEEAEVRNTFIDCGSDGRKELLVAKKFTTPTETFENKMIFKADEDGLKLCFCGDSWSRKVLSVNEFGYIVGIGAGGAFNTSYERYYVDGEGSCHFLYGDEVEYAEKGDFSAESQIYSYSDYGLEMDDMIIFYYYFEETDKETTPNYIYTYAKHGEYGTENDVPYFDSSIMIDASIYEASNKYKDFFENTQVTTITPKEMATLVDEQFKKEGFDTSYIEGEEVLETEADF